MNFQYSSICRGGHSILEKLIKAGIEHPEQYISFFNLRNYDRINTSKVMKQAEAVSGVDYETARKEHDDTVGAGYAGRGEESAATLGNTAKFDAYQKEASNSTTADTVSPCYMLDGPPLTSMNWDSDSSSEMDAFVSEELYIHTKCLIADDRVVIVGSANLNDRSQLGYHDSEMAVVIEDSNMVDSELDGHAYQASKFGTLLRRMLFRKHLGLLAPQDFTKPDVDFMPAGEGENSYDFGSAPDLAVRDVLSDNFQNLWKSTAEKNTEIFDKAFAPVPNNRITTWELYESEYASLFVSPSPKGTKEEDKKPSKYAYGHVVKDNFPGGVGELKEWLGGVRGTLVTMPLDFLSNVKDLVKEGLGYNAMTEEIYT
jgi:phospholipase D1/2